ncbi:MAG: HlyD family efflux transporter periplasmic adaptor subunit [Oscillospiraceae bacterium]|nr:HlyD family efflux transporter periplasmic adaptor subunit [Oscillospiraceae bacterium]
MEEKGKRRDWVKNAAIILLAGLLVLTFFSNTIMNRNLPEVATQNIMSGSINAQVRGSGTVSANGTHVVKADQTREIRAVMVKNGQTVEAGDVLFVLGSGDSAELQQAQEQLYQLQLNYQRTALSGSSTDFSADERRVELAWEAVEEAQLILDAVIVEETDGSERMAFLREQVDNYTVEWNNAKQKYADDELYFDGLIAAADTEKTIARDEVIRAEGWEAEELTSEQEQMLKNPADRILELASDPESDPALLEKWTTLKEKIDALDDINANKAATMDEDQFIIQQAEDRLAELQAEIDEAIAGSEKYRAAKDAFDQAYLNYLDLQAALDARKDAEARSNANVGLELRELNRQIEEQKKKIEELSGGTENQITANVSGTILSIECTAGDTVAKDGILCTIEVPDMGYTMSFSVPNAQASRLRIGDTATVSNTYWGSQITATLESIRVDPKNPQTNKLLTFDVSGDVTAGMDLTISVGQRSANYDMIVPKSALHNDSTGYYVFKVESRNSPLGNRYIARRVTVEILAEDDNNVAIAGELYWGDYVITTSSAPIKNGDMVRLAD